jgi:hypothetical protein
MRGSHSKEGEKLHGKDRNGGVGWYRKSRKKEREREGERETG